MKSSKTKTTLWVVDQGQWRSRIDQLATEEPLEIRLVDPQRPVAITMRTPGADFELAAGFLYSEGIVHHRHDIQRLSYCVDPTMDGEQRHNIVNVALSLGLFPDLQPLERHFYTTSACGVCGKASLEALQLQGYAALVDTLQVDASVIYTLSDRLRSQQAVFRSTGGLHAAALFDCEGNLLAVKEDVGRHNALDKLIGSAFLSDELPWRDRIVMVSGRLSFELVQKCLAAGAPMLCAVSAPSSLAVALAQAFNMTLIGFLRGDRFNIYSGKHRIQALK
ncbi:MAG: formate dehydrogenase accessory sulfurtransferase FdhD [Oculatellaceae cyanobacterium bins.114]|nr:formate dehydrogenase accessory sulfurtransferase FdhD [Oculatellaceae cyanobacterium bins.114]